MSSPQNSPIGREAEVRERIFASALKRFSQKGFAATSLREVSEASGIPMAELVRVVPAAAVRPIVGVVWFAARLGVQRVRGGGG